MVLGAGVSHEHDPVHQVHDREAFRRLVSDGWNLRLNCRGGAVAGEEVGDTLDHDLLGQLD